MTREEAKRAMLFAKREVMADSYMDKAYDVAIKALGEPERKKGKWMYGENEFGNDGYYCSVCGNFVPWKYGEYDIDFIREFLFCNKCGADMRGEQE